MASKKKVFIIAGHGEGDPGACSIWGHEADYTRELATLVQEALKDKLTVVMYDQNKNCYAQSKRGNVPDYAAYDFTLEVHFNAKAKKDPYGDGRFTGIGGYIHPNNAGRTIARAIIDQVVALGFKEWLLDTSTGLLNLNRAQAAGAKYFLIETAFIDDGDDMTWYTAHKAQTAQAIAQGILIGLGLKSQAAQPAEKQAESYYRVRTSWEDVSSQKFAGTQENAVKLAKTLPGYSVFDPDGKCIYTNEQAGTQAASWAGCSEVDFITKVGKLYSKDEIDSGILACVSLAQAILESGYGSTDLAQKANNLHGMKCSLSGNTWPGTTWNGDKYTKMSPECDNAGNTWMQQSDFRVYGCVEDSIADHSAYLLGAANGSAQRYAGLAGEKDYRKAAQIIKDGGYATDPKYVDKLVDIIERWNLAQYNADAVLGDNPQPQEGAAGAQKQPSAAPTGGVPYLVETTCDYLYIRKKPKKGAKVTGSIQEKAGKKLKYTIVEEKKGWGRLKSGIGWISLNYTRKV